MILYRRIINLAMCDGDCLIQFVIFMSAELAVTGQNLSTLCIGFFTFTCSAGTT